MPRLADVKPEISVDHRLLASLTCLFETLRWLGWWVHAWVLGDERLSAQWHGVCEVGLSPVSWAGMSPDPFWQEICAPSPLSLPGVLCPEQGQGDTASAVHPAVPGIVMTLGLMSPPCLGMASLPSRGAGACPHAGEPRTSVRRCFLMDMPGRELCPHQPS